MAPLLRDLGIKSHGPGTWTFIGRTHRWMRWFLAAACVILCSVCSDPDEPIVRKRYYPGTNVCHIWTATFTYSPGSGTTQVNVTGENICNSTVITPDKLVVVLYDSNQNPIGTETATGGTLTIDTPPDTNGMCVTSSVHNDTASGCVTL